jgi:hypothetical protein
MVNLLQMFLARMAVPKFVCGVANAFSFATSMDNDLLQDM